MKNKAFRASRASTTLGIALAACAPAAWGQGFMSQDLIAPGTETFTIDLGGILNRLDTSVRLDGNGTHGTDFNLENNGAAKNLSSFESMLTWRFLPNHRLDVQYYDTKRSGSRDYSKQIVIGDTTYPLGATVSAQAKSQLANIDYRWSFVHTPEVEVAALLGFYGGKFTYDIDAVGSSGGAPRTFHTSVSTTLPLPLLGITFDWYADPRWKFSAQLAGMKAKVGDVDGHAYVAAASAEYMLVRNFGLGLRYSYNDVSADVTKSNFNGNLGWSANSVSLYGKLVF
ncbi:MAG: hypothetical protein ACXWG1_12525 [Usitatibacter sp.]